jgi:hypothetical protein
MKAEYAELVQRLKASYSLLEEDPAEARAMAVLAVRDFLLAVDAHPAAVIAVQSAWSVLADAIVMSDHGNKPGPKPIPFSDVHRLGLAAAAVTALCDCGWSVADAVKGVSKHTAIDGGDLRTLRDNIHRRCANPLISDAYHDFVSRFTEEELTPEGVLSHLRIWLHEFAC